jgi:hypothetical protein
MEDSSIPRRSFVKLLAGGATLGTAALVLGRVGGLNGGTVTHQSETAMGAPSPLAPPPTQSTLRLSRVYRFIDVATGAPQISVFPDNAPSGDTPLEVRMKHFTEIENFTFLGYVLAHELGGKYAKPITTIAGLTVPDAEFQKLVKTAQTDLLTDEDLGDTVLDVGINWEHFVASNNNLMTATDPLKITDLPMQAKIDSLDLIAEALVQEVNVRSIGKTHVKVHVSTVDSYGSPITGYAIELWQNGYQIDSKYSPCTFTVKRGAYQVYANSFAGVNFNHWQDGSTDPYYSFDLTSLVGNTLDLTASYYP